VRWVSRLTTIVIVCVVVGGVFLLIRSKMPNPQVGGDFVTAARFRDASRFQPGSPVVISGVRVGDITGLAIEGRFARVDLRLRGDIPIPRDSFAARRSDSLFGDNYIEIIIGTSPELLKYGEPIQHVEEGGSTDATLRTIARAMPKIDTALERVHGAMAQGRKWVHGSMQQTMVDTDAWLARGRIEAGIGRADKAMEAFERGVNGAADAVAGAGPTLNKRLESFNKAITGARENMRDGKVAITNALTDVRTRLDEADKTIDDVKEVVAAIDEGRGDDYKGTLGRLVNDPGLASSLEDTTQDVREGVAGLNRFKAYLGGRMEFNVRQGSFRYYATAELYTKNDKFYLIEFEKSLLGGAPLATLSDVPNEDEFTKRTEIRERLRFTAQFGKRIGPVRFRAGMRDSTPGVGVDALFLRGRLRFSNDLFGSFDRTPRLKVAGAFAVFRSLYILAGVDDALNPPASLPIRIGNENAGANVPESFKEVKYGRDVFFGFGLIITDADLATMLRFYGALIGAYALAR
jgi:phospholipid/cholesterol/gamma-HCH transport system substrate-binding protein